MIEQRQADTTTTESFDLGQLLAATLSQSEGTAMAGPVIGKIASCDGKGTVWVDYPDNPQAHPLPARSVVAIEKRLVDRDVVLLFERNNASRPIIMGLLQETTLPAEPVTERPPASTTPSVTNQERKRLELTAEREIVLRCGKASIVLTKAGKILLRGAYLLSRSSGSNRIKGASVQIN